MNSSLLDTRLARRGDKIVKLAPTYVIFITENDVLGGGLPMYHINRTVMGMNHVDFGDGSHIIYVNGAFDDESSQIGMLMHDFRCPLIAVIGRGLRDGVEVLRGKIQGEVKRIPVDRHICICYYIERIN